MIENIRGLSSTYNTLSPTADSNQYQADSDKALPYQTTGGNDKQGVIVTLSPEALALAKESSRTTNQDDKKTDSNQFDSSKKDDQETKNQADVDKLKSRDREVRAHEQAHLAAGGNLVRSGAKFEYQLGPDGKRYAVGGEVSIDTSEEKDPQATIRKAERIRQAAMAPANPSTQDMRVAADAAAMAVRAQQELSKQKQSDSGYGVSASKSTMNFQV